MLEPDFTAFALSVLSVAESPVSLKAPLIVEGDESEGPVRLPAVRLMEAQTFCGLDWLVQSGCMKEE